jgi:hypothetical protein
MDGTYLFGRKSTSFGSALSVGIHPDVFRQNEVFGIRDGIVTIDDDRI